MFGGIQIRIQTTYLVAMNVMTPTIKTNLQYDLKKSTNVTYGKSG